MSKDIDKLSKELDLAKKLSEERLNSWKRSAADFENYKKRRAKEDQDLGIFVKEMVLAKLLPTLEALNQSLAQVPEDESFKEWSSGMEKTKKQLSHTLKVLGVEMIKTKGEKYDHSIHEAVEMVEVDEKSGQVIEEVASGYKINGKVVKPAKVRVAK